MQSKKKSQGFILPETPITINDYFGMDSIEKAADLYEKMDRPFLKATDLEIDMPLLGHWVKLLSEKKNDGKHKRYSFTEFVWFKMVEQLRNAGLGFPIIIELKNGILEPIKLKGVVTSLLQKKNYIEELKLPKAEKEKLLAMLIPTDGQDISDEITFTLFHVIIMESLLKKLPLSLAVFLNGTFIIVDKSKEHLYTEADKQKLLFETHVVVSISAILKKLLLSDLSGFVLPEVSLLSYAENKLFEVMRSGEYDSITIHFKDKKMKILELKKSENVRERIVDILEKSEFGEIIVKKHRGVITRIENIKRSLYKVNTGFLLATYRVLTFFFYCTIKVY